MTTKHFILEPNRWVALETTDASECPYLIDRQAQLSFGVVVPDGATFDRLMEQGYRRLGFLFYLPACPGGCRECRPIKVGLAGFSPSKSQRRLLRRYGDRYQVEEVLPAYDDEHFGIYERHALHVSASNGPCTPATYRTAFVDTCVQTHVFEYRIDSQLVAVSILDEGELTVSSVYAFWEPRYRECSPGTFSALWEMQWARQRAKQYYHIGYWIRDCERMSYKSRFRPHQLMDWATKTWHTADTKR